MNVNRPEFPINDNSYKLIKPQTKRNNNAKRQSKINSKVRVLLSQLLNKLEKYMIGEEVETVHDTLGNEYISVVIGEKDCWNAKKGKLKNQKTDDIFRVVYSKMASLGYIVCQKHVDFNIEAWLLVKEINNE